jgi:cbb3-type cytochrome c oxidase subunit III
MTPFSPRVAIPAVVALMLAMPGALAAFPWSIDMYRGQAVQPLAVAPRVMPPGTVPTRGGDSSASRIASIRLPNPLPPTRDNAARGAQLFETTCAPCHGSAGKGDGPVKFLLRVPPTDLTGEAVTGMSDGYIYGTIRYGSIAMPSYADALSASERWEVVLFVRSLQGRLAQR